MPSPSLLETGPSLLWYRRFCLYSPVHTIQQQRFVAPHRERFFQLLRAHGVVTARIWLLGALIHEAITKTEAMQAAMPPSEEG